jgi:hypothetical protein
MRCASAVRLKHMLHPADLLTNTRTALTIVLTPQTAALLPYRVQLARARSAEQSSPAAGGNDALAALMAPPDPLAALMAPPAYSAAGGYGMMGSMNSSSGSGMNSMSGGPPTDGRTKRAPPPVYAVFAPPPK